MSEEKKVSEFIVSVDALQATLNYLGTRPYQEVAQLIAVLRQSKPVLNEEEKAQKKGK